jgi:LytS/YehU family sensor histidine kinase
MMRYVLYDSEQDSISLDKEIQFLQHYIQLMRLRYSDSVEIVVDVPENSPSQVKIPPLIFIVFVENAFKHGISYNKNSFININIFVDKNELTCVVANSRHYSQSKEHSGIGLNNITKRLDLLFGNRYLLDIDDKDQSRYIVKLVIPVNF